MNTKVLICIPTFNRPCMVREVLEYELKYYTKLGLDICYYDSSDSLETEYIVNEFIHSGYKNLSIKKTPVNQCIDVKLFNIIKNEERLKEYDYIWLINDSISITEKALIVILKLLDERYDLIRLPLAGSGPKEDRLYTKPNDWFYECSQGMAHMASTIMSTSLIRIETTEWDYLYQKYIVNDDVEDENHGFFFMVGFYLEQILKIDNFKGLFIGNRIKWRRDSPLKKNQIYWSNIVFRVWAFSYPNTILALPDVYTKKKEVIRNSDNLGPGRFSECILINYRIQGLLDRHIFRKYYCYFPLVSDVPIHRIRMISWIPIKILKIFQKEVFIDGSQWEQNLEKIEIELNKYRKIIIYGAGLYGEKSVIKLKKDGFGKKLLSIAVSDPRVNLSEIEGIKVRSIDSLVEYEKESIVLIATLPEAAKQIYNTLKELGFKHMISLFGGKERI